jgi:hypothetical protein
MACKRSEIQVIARCALTNDSLTRLILHSFPIMMLRSWISVALFADGSAPRHDGSDRSAISSVWLAGNKG